jgi:hypothetical protein
MLHLVILEYITSTTPVEKTTTVNALLYLAAAKGDQLDRADPATKASPPTTRLKFHREFKNAFLIATKNACSSVFASLR